MNRTVARGPVVALVLSLALVASTSSSATADAKHPKPPNSYGAIALNIKGHSGTSSHYRTRAGAFKAALRTCDKGGSKYACVKVGWVENACGAVWFKLGPDGLVSTDKGDRPHFAYSTSLEAAKRKARRGHHGGHFAKICT